MKQQLIKSLPWIIALVLGFALLLTLFDGCGGENKSFIKDLEKTNKELLSKNDSIFKSINARDQQLHILRENEIVITKELQSITTQNERLKAKSTKSKNDWISTISIGEAIKDTACAIALNDCGEFSNGLENEILKQKERDQNKSFQIDSLSKNIDGFRELLKNDTTLLKNKDELIKLLKKQNSNFKAFAGVFGQYSSKTNLPDCGISADIQIKNALIGVQYGILQNSVSVSAKYKLSFRRNGNK